MPFPINKEQIIITEKELSITFPDSFKTKMEKENGGTFVTDEDDWELIPFKDTTDNKRIKRTCNDLLYEYKQANEWKGFSENLYPFAKNGCGDFLVFRKDEIKNEIVQEVYFWNHENGELTVLFKSFDEIEFD